ncbi:MAG TPA: DNA recombination protein RmuC [Acidimicrobiales bacterium]|nr:DNA recombination protein RmuC [Acidimicrobiales bacterium]
MLAALILGLVFGALGGAAFGYLVAAGRTSRSAAVERERAAASAKEEAEAREKIVADLVRAEALLDQERASNRIREEVAHETRRQAAGQFAELSAAALQQNTEQFLALADRRMREAQQAAVADMDQRRVGIEQLFAPLREQLGRYEEGIRSLEKERQSAYAGLSAQVAQLNSTQDRLQQETRNLVTALRSPTTRGRWGELQLRRVVEMAGMLEHCDFEEQVTTQVEEGRLRPDLVVRLPGRKQIVVDAKVPLQAFLDANDAIDEEGRRAHLANHARQLRAHVDALGKKAYWQQFESSPEFVVAFVPGDQLLGTALEHDPSLLEHALVSRVLLATPTSLIAVLRTVAHSWQQENLADNAREVQSMARDLYKRMATFGEHLGRVGKGLSGAVDSYNRAVGSLERSVMPQARRFHELGVVSDAEKTMPELEPVDCATRVPIVQELDEESADVLQLLAPDSDDLPEAGHA